jgi:hypothetical protein
MDGATPMRAPTARELSNETAQATRGGVTQVDRRTNRGVRGRSRGTSASPNGSGD